MNKTLFWYIFGNLFRVFLMTTAGLAGMMSFAVLLRPLTENGLEFNQVNRLLLYSLPAVSRLFIARQRVVRHHDGLRPILRRQRDDGHARLRDQLFSARRFSIALPALVLGLVVAVISLLMLCFIVPAYSEKVEEVIYSNIARVIANQIERTHSLPFQNSDGSSYNIYADGARMAFDPQRPWIQSVELLGPASMKYYKSPSDPNRGDSQGILDGAQRAGLDRPLVIHPDGDCRADRRHQVPENILRERAGRRPDARAFGPFEIPSLITENVKFMNITRLAQLAQDPGQSEDVQVILRELRRLQQQQEYLAVISAAMNHHAADGTSNYLFPNDSPEEDAFQIGGQNAKLEWRSGYLVIAAPGSTDDRTVWMRQTHGSQLTLYAHAKEIDIRVQPNVDPRSTTGPAADRFNVNVELFNVELETQNGVKTPRGSFARSFSVPMSAAIRAINTKRLVDFLGDPVIEPGDGARVNRPLAGAV